MTAGGYRYGFNGKENDNEVKGEGNQQDYGMRVYDPRIAKFLSVDPISKDYPYLTPFQFASNTPISGVDLDGKEHYFAADGSYIGVGNKANKTVRVVDSKAIQTLGNVAKIHAAAENKSLSYKSPKMMTENSDKSFSSVDLTIDVMLNNAHSIYGESGSKSSEYLKLAHTLYNREIKYAKYIDELRHTVIGLDQKTGAKLYSTVENNKVLKLDAEYGFNRYVAFGVYMPMNPKAVDAFRETFEVTGIQMDNGKQNMNYLNFFKSKSDISALQINIPNVKQIFKEIIDARTGQSQDPNPNSDGWRGDGKTNTVRNEMPKYKSDL